jgi:hypothetical protein
MKKILFITLLSFISLVSLGQIMANSVSVKNSNETTIAKNRCGRFVLEDSVYVIKFRDALTPQFIEVKLGNKEQALESIKFLYQFAYEYDKKAFFTMEQDGQEITFYKYAETAFMVSYGDVDFCRETYKASMVSGLVGGYYGQNRIDNPMYSWVDRVFIRKCMEGLQPVVY